MKEIPLTRGYVALVDDEDYERVNAIKWHPSIVRNKNGVTVYAGRSISISGKRLTVYMHRFVLGSECPRKVDHQDTNGLNNQKQNLRPCSQSQNMANGLNGLGGSSKFKGVSWYTSRNRWEAYITKDLVRRRIGYFKNEIEAAMAYNTAAVKAFGEFARLNEIPNG